MRILQNNYSFTNTYKKINPSENETNKLTSKEILEEQNQSSKVNETIKLDLSKSVTSNYYVQFFPTRDSSGALSLANGVINPSIESFSKNKSFDDVASSARIELDFQYDSMKESGENFDINSSEGTDIYTLFQNLDRRALYAVSSNESNQFTKEEQEMASFLMASQLGLAMGLYSGPNSLSNDFIDPFLGDYATRMKKGIEFLNNVSDEEKTSGEWLQNKTNLENAYNSLQTKSSKLDDSKTLVEYLFEAEKKDNEHPYKNIDKNSIKNIVDISV